MKIQIEKAALCHTAKGTYRDIDIWIENGKIAAVGGELPDFQPDRRIDGRNMLVVPGFINAHSHAYMTVLRGCGDDLDFTTWLFQRVMPLEEQLTPEDAYWSTLLGCVEMLQGGVTSFLDMHMFPNATAQAALDIGMSAVLSRGLTGGDDDQEGGARRLREARAEMEAFCGEPSLSFMLAPHAPYTCDAGYLRTVAERAAEWGVGIHTHLAESVAETETVRERYGCSPAEFYDQCGVLGPRTVAAHCVQLSASDMDLLAERGVAVALNPASNLKLMNGVAPAGEMLRRGIRLCLGTDSTASNNRLSILREMGLTALLQPDIHAGKVFRMATCWGAQALGYADRGELEPGMRADIALFDMRQCALQPCAEPASALAYAGSGLAAHTVLSGGEVVLEGGAPTRIDAGRVRYEVQKIAQRLGLFSPYGKDGEGK